MAELKTSAKSLTHKGELKYPPDIVADDNIGWYCLHHGQPAILYGAKHEWDDGTTYISIQSTAFIPTMVAIEVLKLNIMQLPPMCAIERCYTY